ncbi:imelysin family protein [Aestuariibius sp. 2305UL40-4]|uniref:imelysin family protein n=1 Tax=Aestuariibius violaceus TaxID=3234132 RepID=UPI00345E5019
MRGAFLALLAIPSVATADVERAITDHILPGYEAFEDATLALREVGNCDPVAVEPAYHAAFDAWMGISHIQFGPIEDQNLMLAIAFWPDPKNSTGRALGQLARDADPIVLDPATFAEVSVAARGLFAMERLLAEPPVEGEYLCALLQAVAVDLGRSAEELNGAWTAHAALMRNPGPENPAYRSQEEVERALFTSLATGLEFLHDQRLGRPLGTFDRPRPLRAEARRSRRSLRNVTLSLMALRDLSATLANAPELLAAFDRAIETAEGIDDPAFEGVARPGSRLRIEALQSQVRQIQELTEETFGIEAGFNALDGD